MTNIKKRKSGEQQHQDGSTAPNKRVKAAPDPYDRPKSKKELRAEKKAARKKAAEAAGGTTTTTTAKEEINNKPLSMEEYKQHKQRLRKEKRKELLKQQLKEERKEKKIRQRKRLNRELNAPKSNSTTRINDGRSGNSKKNNIPKQEQQEQQPKEEQEVSLKVLTEVIHGSRDDASGMTTTQLGVQYKDLVTGNGVTVQNNNSKKQLVIVKYKLTGGKYNAILDMSNNFRFRVGNGEVIQGWDIGLIGMREGGRRKLVVPPKAGYGSQDIGAGPGAMLTFDITLLKVENK